MTRRGTVRLFVYGTLQPQAGTRMARWIAARQVRSRAASVPGRLFAIRSGRGWFPALLPAKAGTGARVQGTLCELALRPGELALLDRYEGGEYRRVSLPVRIAGGRAGMRAGPALLYRWRIALPVGAQGIPSGDFLGWLAQTRHQAFGAPQSTPRPPPHPHSRPPRISCVPCALSLWAPPSQTRNLRSAWLKGLPGLA